MKKFKNFTVSCFPLLCKIYTSDKESKFSDKEFFQKPLSLLRKDIDGLKTNDPVRYFCLLYCMINDSNLDKCLLSVNEETKKIKTVRKTLLEICELPSSFSRENIKKKMDTLLNTYIRQEGNNYQFIHDIIHDAVIKHVNGLESDFKRIILHHCSSKFLNERIRLSSIVHSHTQGEYLILNSDLESEWSARILQDMKNGHWKDLINNTTLHDERGDLLLAESITTLNNTDFQTLIFLSFPCVMVLPLLEATQKDSSVFILNISDVTILHLIVYLGLKNCLLEILKSKSVPSVTLQQLNLNLLLLATTVELR